MFSQSLESMISIFFLFLGIAKIGDFVEIKQKEIFWGAAIHKLGGMLIAAIFLESRFLWRDIATETSTGEN